MQIKIFQCFLAVIFVIIPACSFAQSTNLDGYNLQYMRPTSDGRELIVVAPSATLGHLIPQIAFFLNGSRGHLGATNAQNNRISNVVDTLLTGDLLFGLGLMDFIDVGVDIPVHFYERGRDFNDGTVFEASGVGDIRFDLKFRLLKEKKTWPGIAFLSSIYAPTGETAKFTGYKTVSYEGRLILDKVIRSFYASVNLGYRVLPHQNIVNMTMDDEFTFGLGGCFVLPVLRRSVELFSEVFGSMVVSDPSEKTTPVEIMWGVRKRFGNNLSATLAGGTGLTSGSGSPAWRVLLGVNYRFGKRGQMMEVHEINRNQTSRR